MAGAAVALPLPAAMSIAASSALSRDLSGPLPGDLAVPFAGAGLLPPNDSRSRRATGASTVDDADLTNSPCSLSRARTSLLVTPSSLANSCTRALPAATTSPVHEATVVGRASGLAMTHCHRDFTVCSMFYCYLFCCPVVRARLETPGTRPLRMCPANRRCAALLRKPAAESLVARTAVADAATHPAPAGWSLYQRSRRSCRSRSTQPPLEAVRRPTLAFGTRHTSAPVRGDYPGVDAPRPKARAGSRLSVASPGKPDCPAICRGITHGASGRAPYRG